MLESESKQVASTTECASRLNSWGMRSAACLIRESGKALLVYVPYGSQPGWDFPGGTKHEGEFSCQVAERETCEETGHKVRAIRQISPIVFECEILAKNVCKKAVDEGFLKKKWVSASEVDGLQLRGWTWGDKRAILKAHLGKSSSSPAHPEARDACNCLACQGQGFSSHAQTCAAGHSSSSQEACACLQRSGGTVNAEDSCGCRPCLGEGWSSTLSKCVQGHETSSEESCMCER